jgi:hypothetical protein
MVEVLISTVLVGGLALATIAGAGGLVRARAVAADGARALTLAHDLLAEVTSLPVDPPPSAPTPPTGRDAFDDLLDFNAYSESPVADRDATPLPGFAGWSRRVDITRVTPALAPTGADTGIFLVTVTVSRDGVPLARAQSLRTRAADQAVAEGHQAFGATR